jgi:hypothetical protein
MKHALVIHSVLFALLVSCSFAAEAGSVNGKIVDVQRKAHTRVLYYVVDTPITRDDPYFEVSVQIKDKIYIGEYTLRRAGELLPEVWKPGAEVAVRLKKHVMFLRRPDGEESEFEITRHTSAPASSPTSPSGTPRE